MQINFLDNIIRRTVTTCNMVAVDKTVHTDRLMYEHDLLYIYEGEWEIYQNHVPYLLSPGDYLLLHSGHPHYGILPSKSDTRIAYLHFSCALLDCLSEDDAKKEQNNFYSFPVHGNCTQFPVIPHLIGQIINTFWSNDLNRQVHTSALLDLLLCELENQYYKQTPPSPYNFEPLLQHMNRQQQRFFTIDELANYMGISNKTLTFHFKNYTGFTVHQYQLNRKLDMAHDLIAYRPHITLKELASCYGFYDEYHFHKCYKKKFGHPPKA